MTDMGKMDWIVRHAYFFLTNILAGMGGSTGGSFRGFDHGDFYTF